MDIDKLENNLEEIQGQLMKFEKKLVKGFSILGMDLISYIIAIGIYLWIYESFGWERTIITIGVGFIVFSLKSNMNKKG